MEIRQTFLPIVLVLICLVIGVTHADLSAKTNQKEIDKILQRIKLPHIPTQTFNIRDFGIENGILQNCKPAIDAAIQACASKGGGKIIIPAGNYFCKGPIHLLSNIELHFDDGAVITFSQNPDDYLPVVLVRWEGTECYNYSPYFYARDQKNIAVTGKGRLNGNAKGGLQLWVKKQDSDQNLLRKMGKEGTPLNERIFGSNHLLRPGFIEFVNCENVLISDLQIENVPFWIIHPIYCKSVTVRDIVINSRFINNDGCDPESCEDMLVENCSFTTGDDAIAFKSGRDQDGWRVNKSTKNVVIRNCKAPLTLHGVSFGSEISGGLENVYVQNFQISKVDNYALQFKSNKDRGGLIRNIHIDGFTVDSARTAIFFTNDYHGFMGGNAPTTFQDITIRNYTCKNASEMGIDMVGLEERPIKNIQFENVKVKKIGTTNRMKNTENITFKKVVLALKNIQSGSDLSTDK